MNEILFSNRELPRLRAAEYLVIASPFVHVDRIAPFHVLIYVTSGTIYVTEEELESKIHMDITYED